MVKALIETATGRVVNVVRVDQVKGYEAPNGFTLVDATADCEVGGTWDGTRFIRKPEPPPPEKSEVEKRLDAIEARLDALEGRK